MRENIGVLVDAEPGPGNLHKLAGVIAQHDANITSVDIIEEHLTYFEIDVTDGPAVIGDLAKLLVVRRVTQVKTFQTVFGKRIIIMGGGAQVGQVAAGAISEADNTTSAENTSPFWRFPWWASNRSPMRFAPVRGYPDLKLWYWRGAHGWRHRARRPRSAGTRFAGRQFEHGRQEHYLR